MRIALDYDGTYTADPVLWDAFIAQAQGHGHEVICITMRHEHEEIAMPCRVIYTSRQAKKPAAIAYGIEIDIWIDDSRHWIMVDSP